jgi:hypothetical protein
MSGLIAWLLDVAGGAALARIGSVLAPNPLVIALDNELRRWAAEALTSTEKNPAALLAHLFAASAMEAPARNALREKLERRDAPDAVVWFDALYERWDHIRAAAGEDARTFFKLPPEVAEPLLRDLAKRLERVCIQVDSAMGIGAIVDAIADLRAVILQDRASRYSLDDARSAFFDYSQPLLTWPTTITTTGDRIPRPEHDAVMNRLRQQEPTSTIIVGARGSGKSALLASVASEVVENGWTLFGIKADLLTESTEDEVRTTLGFDARLPEVLRESALQNKTVLIIDQLDAVAEIADRSARRLNLLLNLVKRIAGAKNLHIVLSSRPFELRTDTRLRTISAEEVELTLPSWESVAPVLLRTDHTPEAFGDAFRELLRNPWALNMYVEIAKPDQQFGSMAELLDGVWHRDVTSAPDGAERATLLHEIANAMTADEQLSVPTSLGDERPSAVTGLIASGFLIRDGVRLSFRHQTFYEFILARQFARDDAAFIGHILSRQDGLFVRPSIVATLTAMRESRRPRYTKIMETLLARGDIRLHVRALVVDFIASQRDPDGREVALVIPLLNDELFAPRILLAAAGSSEWFRQFVRQESFRKIIADRNSAPQALGVLVGAVRTDRDVVFELVREYWISDSQFDVLTAQVVSSDGTYADAALQFASTILKRSEAEWLIEEAAEPHPEAAIHLLAIDVRRKVKDDVITRAAADELGAAEQILKPLTSDTRHELLEELATRRPAMFIEKIWPWFASVCVALAAAPYLPARYRSIWSLELDHAMIPYPTIIQAFLTAAREMARSEPLQFKAFARAQASTEILVLQVIIAAGMEILAVTDPDAAADFITADARRLSLGLRSNRHEFSRKVIAAAFGGASGEWPHRIETAITTFEMYPSFVEDAETSAEKRTKWNREHRLELLQSIPDDAISAELKALREVLRAEFPDIDAPRPAFFSGTVGPRVTSDELGAMDDDARLALFDEITDSDEDTFHFGLDIARSGGVHVQANAVTEFIKAQPEGGVVLLQRLQPSRHQRYAAAIVEGIAESSSVSDLARIAWELDTAGFHSHELRARVAAVLGKAAKAADGLSDSTIQLFETWLDNYPDEADVARDRASEGSSDTVRPLVVSPWGLGMTTPIPHSSQIADAIAEGLLNRPHPEVKRWLAFFHQQVARRSDWTFWWHMLTHMSYALNAIPSEANNALGSLFRRNPCLLQNVQFLRFIAHYMVRLEPSRVRTWIAWLRESGRTSDVQAFGELLALVNAWHDDEWSRHSVREAIAIGPAAVLTGIGFVAPLGWSVPRLRAMWTAVLKTITARAPSTGTAAVTEFLNQSVDEPIDFETEDILRTVIANAGAARDMIDPLIAISENNASEMPQLAIDIAQCVLTTLGSNLNASGAHMRVAAELTTVALTVHRQPQDEFRVAGLQLFERLIQLGVREADAALEILDRRPRKHYAGFHARRRYRRGRGRR